MINLTFLAGEKTATRGIKFLTVGGPTLPSSGKIPVNLLPGFLECDSPLFLIQICLGENLM